MKHRTLRSGRISGLQRWLPLFRKGGCSNAFIAAPRENRGETMQGYVLLGKRFSTRCEWFVANLSTFAEPFLLPLDAHHLIDTTEQGFLAPVEVLSVACVFADFALPQGICEWFKPTIDG